MSVECHVFLAACALTAICAGWMTLSPSYDDGVLGKIALVTVLVGAIASVVYRIEDWDLAVSRPALLTQTGLAGLLVWRAWRLWVRGS